MDKQKLYRINQRQFYMIGKKLLSKKLEFNTVEDFRKTEYSLFYIFGEKFYMVETYGSFYATKRGINLLPYYDKEVYNG